MQYDRIRESKLLANDIDLVVVSIGKPDVGQQLMRHLDISDGGDGWFFCDPDNVLYDALDLNSGIGNLITMDTSYAFRDRIFGINGRTDGLMGLFDVLGKWKDAVYLPPKPEQALQQGATFIFKGIDTIYAHYDASTGAHAPVHDALRIGLNATNE